MKIVLILTLLISTSCFGQDTTLYHTLIPINPETGKMDSLHKTKQGFNYRKQDGYVKITKESKWIKCVALFMKTGCPLSMTFDDNGFRMPDMIIVNSKEIQNWYVYAGTYYDKPVGQPRSRQWWENK